MSESDLKSFAEDALELAAKRELERDALAARLKEAEGLLREVTRTSCFKIHAPGPMDEICADCRARRFLEVKP